MDTDSLPSAPVFLVFLLAFSYLSLLEQSRAVRNGQEREQNPTRVSGTLLTWLKTGCIFAVVLSGFALVHATATTEWWPIALMAVGLLAGLFLLDRLMATLSIRNPKIATPWSTRPKLVANGHGGYSGNGEGNSSGIPNQNGALVLEPDSPAITEEELTSLDDRDREMLRSILRLDATAVREVMVQRLDMDAVEAEATLENVAEAMIGRGHSRLAVYEDTIDHILGIVHARDVMAALAWPKPDNSLRNLVRPAFIIPETKRVDDLLEEMQERRTQIAIVVDEYGGTEGLVTMEDLLEEIVGEIEDEFSRTREAQIIRQADGAVLVDAVVTTEEIEEIFGTPIESSEVDTVGGYVYHSLGRIPQAGDVVETDDLHIEVVSILGRRLRKLRIRRLDHKATEQSV